MPSLARLPPPVLRIENYENYVDPARVVMGALTEGLDDTPATLTLSFPADPAAPLSLLQNARVIVTVDDRYVFVGHIRRVSRSGSGLDRSVTAVAYDARHTMSGRIVGQYGIGEIPTKGGWYGVGYDCEFNPDGKPNKTPYPCLVAPSRGVRFENVYRFARPGHHEADWWYNIDVLLWLLNWYAAADVVEIDTDALNSIATLASLCTVRDVNATPLPRALTTVLRSCGLRWTIRYDNRDCNVIGESEPVGVFTVLAVVSHPALQRQMNERIEEQAKALDQQVKAGKVKRVEADRALAVTRAIAQPAILKTLGGVMAAGFGVVRVFWWGLVLWLLGRVFLKACFGYIKTLEVAGLALMVSVLGSAVLLLLMVNLPKLFAAQGLALAVSDFDPSRKS